MPSDVGWLARAAPAPIDATLRFHELYAKPVPLPEGVGMWLVPGIFTRFYPAYLRRIRVALGAREVPIDTEGRLHENAAAIRDAVLRETRPVVLIGHSKGPLDIHAALLLYPEIVPRVRAFVSLQAPFAGTPLATDLEESRFRWLAPRSYFDMGYRQRRSFLEERAPIPPVPTVALATQVGKAGLFLETTRRYLSRYGPSDGFVPLLDAPIPGARVVRLEGLDHAAVALRWLRPKAPYEAGRIVQALVALALE